MRWGRVAFDDTGARSKHRLQRAMERNKMKKCEPPKIAAKVFLVFHSKAADIDSSDEEGGFQTCDKGDHENPFEIWKNVKELIYASTLESKEDLCSQLIKMTNDIEASIN